MKSLFIAAAVAASTLSTAAFAAPPRAVPPPPPGVSYSYDRRDDVMDLRRFESLQARYQQASRRRDVRQLRALDDELRGLMLTELRESRRESDRRALARMRDISRSLQPLYGRVDRRSVARKLALIDEAVELARREVRPAPRPRPPMARR